MSAYFIRPPCQRKNKKKNPQNFGIVNATPFSINFSTRILLFYFQLTIYLQPSMSDKPLLSQLLQANKNTSLKADHENAETTIFNTTVTCTLKADQKAKRASGYYCVVEYQP